jgi:hypothetical protein
MGPLKDDTLLTSEELSEAWRAEFNVTYMPGTLQTWRTNGGGPAFEKVGPSFVRYRWGKSRDWMAARISAPKTCTADKASAA